MSEEQNEKTENTVEIQTDKSDKPWLFKKGQSGNPAGKPKGAKHFTTIVREAMKEEAKIVGGGTMEIEKAIGKKVVQMALDGNEQMIKLIWNYMDGTPKATLEIDDARKDETKEQLADIIKKLDGKQRD